MDLSFWVSSLKASLKTIGIFGLVIIFCHNLFPIIPFGEGSIVKTILSPLFGPGAFPITPQTNFIMAYPPVPWLGIMLVGFASGKLFELPDDKRKKVFLEIGLGALLFFVVLRFINIYGDPSLWSSQKNSLYTFLSFMNVTKYPPSLLFCLITLGIMFLILAFAEQVENKVYGFCICLRKSSFVLFYSSLLHHSHCHDCFNVFARLSLVRPGFCFRNFWAAKRRGKRFRALGNLSNLDCRCMVII